MLVNPETIAGAIIVMSMGLIKIYFEIRKGNEETAKVHLIVNSATTELKEEIKFLKDTIAKLTESTRVNGEV